MGWWCAGDSDHRIVGLPFVGGVEKKGRQVSISAWPGIVNFRDVGGHGLPGGQVVKTGWLFRGSSLDVATQADLAKMADLGIELVFDLRSADEAAGRPDRLPVGASYQRQPAIVSMDEVKRESLNWDALIEFLSSSEEALAESEAFHQRVYAQMIERPSAFKALVGQLLARPSQAVYVHCSAGKDRTGVATAIVLRLLGATRRTVMLDYLESGEHPLPDFAAARQRAESAGQRVGAVVALMTGVSQWQLDLAFSQVKLSWGSWAGFVSDGLGLSTGDVEVLRHTYLEPVDASGVKIGANAAEAGFVEGVDDADWPDLAG